MFDSGQQTQPLDIELCLRLSLPFGNHWLNKILLEQSFCGLYSALRGTVGYFAHANAIYLIREEIVALITDIIQLIFICYNKSRRIETHQHDHRFYDSIQKANELTFKVKLCNFNELSYK